MRLVKQISEDEVFSRWFINEAKGRLGEDLESFVQRYPHYRAIVEKPNFESEFENRKRAVLCWLSRGAILFQLPLDVVWYQAEISEDDFKSLFVIADNWWSKHYGSGSDKLSTISDEVNLRKDIPYIKSLLENIDEIDPNLIIIGKKNGPFTVIDGVHRAIALYIHFFLLKKEKWTSFDVFIGISQVECIWQRNRV